MSVTRKVLIKAITDKASIAKAKAEINSISHSINNVNSSGVSNTSHAFTALAASAGVGAVAMNKVSDAQKKYNDLLNEYKKSKSVMDDYYDNFKKLKDSGYTTALVDAKGNIRKYNKELYKSADAFVVSTRAVRKNKEELSKLKSTIEATELASKRLWLVLKGAGVVIGLASAYVYLNDKLTQFAQLSMKIPRFVKDMKEYEKVMLSLSNSSIEGSTSVRGLEKLFMNIRTSTKDVEEALAVTDTLSKAMGIAGVSAEESGRFMLQFGQAAAQGMLRAEEFNTLIEVNKPLMVQVAKSMGMSFSEMLKNVKNGTGIAMTEVMTALVNINGEVSNQLSNIPITFAAQWETTKGLISNIIGDIGLSMESTVGASLKEINKWIVENKQSIVEFGVAVLAIFGSVYNIIVTPFKILYKEILLIEKATRWIGLSIVKVFTDSTNAIIEGLNSIPMLNLDIKPLDTKAYTDEMKTLSKEMTQIIIENEKDAYSVLFDASGYGLQKRYDDGLASINKRKSNQFKEIEGSKKLVDLEKIRKEQAKQRVELEQRSLSISREYLDVYKGTLNSSDALAESLYDTYTKMMSMGFNQQDFDNYAKNNFGDAFTVVELDLNDESRKAIEIYETLLPKSERLLINFVKDYETALSKGFNNDEAIKYADTLNKGILNPTEAKSTGKLIGEEFGKVAAKHLSSYAGNLLSDSLFGEYNSSLSKSALSGSASALMQGKWIEAGVQGAVGLVSGIFGDGSKDEKRLEKQLKNDDKNTQRIVNAYNNVNALRSAAGLDTASGSFKSSVELFKNGLKDAFNTALKQTDFKSRNSSKGQASLKQWIEDIYGGNVAKALLNLDDYRTSDYNFKNGLKEGELNDINDMYSKAIADFGVALLELTDNIKSQVTTLEDFIGYIDYSKDTSSIANSDEINRRIAESNRYANITKDLENALSFDTDIEVFEAIVDLIDELGVNLDITGMSTEEASNAILDYAMEVQKSNAMFISEQEELRKIAEQKYTIEMSQYGELLKFNSVLEDNENIINQTTSAVRANTSALEDQIRLYEDIYRLSSESAYDLFKLNDDVVSGFRDSLNKLIGMSVEDSGFYEVLQESVDYTKSLNRVDFKTSQDLLYEQIKAANVYEGIANDTESYLDIAKKQLEVTKSISNSSSYTAANTDHIKTTNNMMVGGVETVGVYTDGVLQGLKQGDFVINLGSNVSNIAGYDNTSLFETFMKSDKESIVIDGKTYSKYTDINGIKGYKVDNNLDGIFDQSYKYDASGNITSIDLQANSNISKANTQITPLRPQDMKKLEELTKRLVEVNEYDVSRKYNDEGVLVS